MDKRNRTPEEVEASRLRRLEKARLRAAAYRAANPEKVAAYRKTDTAKASHRRTTAKYAEKYTAARQRWERENRDRRQAAQREQYRQNPEAGRARALRWLNTPGNREKVAARAKASKDRPEVRDRIAISKQNRRARIKGSGGQLSRGITAKLLQLQRGLCAGCGCDITLKHQRDHIVPLALGGPHEDSNIQLLCPPCNHQKNAKDPIAWANSIGRLL